MFFFVNLLGLVVFLGIGVLASRNRKEIQWRSVASLLTLNLMLAWFLTSFEIGREMITAAAAGFTELINISYVGIAFVFPDWVHVPQMNHCCRFSSSCRSLTSSRISAFCRSSFAGLASCSHFSPARRSSSHSSP